MNDRVFSKENDLARCAGHDCLNLGLITPRPLARQSQPLKLSHQPIAPDRSRPFEAQPFSPKGGRSLVDGADCAGFEEGGFEVVDQVGRVFDTDAEPNQVFGKVTRGADGGVDRGVAVRGGQHDPDKRCEPHESRDSRHEAGHRDERVDATERDTDPPQSRARDDPLTERDVACLETEHGARSARDPVMHGLAAVRRQAGIVDFEAELVEVVGDQDRVGLLLVDAEREGLDATEEQEGVERREAVSDRVDRKSDTLCNGGRTNDQSLQYAKETVSVLAPWQSRPGRSR